MSDIPSVIYRKIIRRWRDDRYQPGLSTPLRPVRWLKRTFKTAHWALQYGEQVARRLVRGEEVRNG